MKKLKVILLFLFAFQCIGHTQPYGDECGMKDNSHQYIVSGTTDGVYKPVRSDKTGGNIVPEPNNMYFPILIICVRFPNESDDHWTWDWHPNEDPNYLNELIATQKELYGNWWDKYNGKLVSDWWQEVSCGKMHVIGRAYSIILDNNWQYYRDEYPDIIQRQRAINEEIWLKVTNKPGFSWLFFDKWAKVNGQWEFGNGDDYVDMIYKVHRTNPSWVEGTVQKWLLPHFEGYGYLSCDEDGWGDSYTYDIPNTTKKIYYNFSPLGSGLTCQGHDRTHFCMNKSPFIDLMGHEHGHFLFGSSAHLKHAKMNKNTNRDFYFSPWERIKFGYITPFEVDYNDDNHTFILNDFSAREQNYPNVLQLPIRDIGGGLKEYFYISNRRKISQYDVLMMGDTARRNAFRNINPDYGKGLYIYHIPRDLEYSDYNRIDIECADGLWNWVVGPSQYPEWSNTDLFPFFFPNTVDREHNDNVALSLNYADGITSFSTLACLFSIGKKHTCLSLGDPCNEATDRINTNSNEAWTSWTCGGDRWDAWNSGYNEIFSPYSSPSTRNWSHQQTGIFVWYKDFNSQTNRATVDIYRGDPESYESMMEILVLTPPSRPMEIKTDYHFVSETLCHPKITWINNTEPDVINQTTGKIRYKLYRAYKLYMDQIPGPPVLIENNLEFYPYQTPSYIDYQIIGCHSILSSGEPWLYPVRYWIKVVDNSNDESVFSDFTSAIGINDGSVPIGGSGSDNLISNSNIPKSFDLKQNYPNPFNPVTNIKYDLPKDVFVSVKIYDLLGREIKTLVNEFKNAGSYLVSFNGSEFASGVYFYRIQAGSFVQVKKMVLIK